MKKIVAWTLAFAIALSAMGYRTDKPETTETRHRIAAEKVDLCPAYKNRKYAGKKKYRK